jgi:hypothetical protein
MTAAQAVDPGLHDLVRRSVRTTLEGSALYRATPPDARRELAQKLVNVAMIAARLLDEDRRLTEQAARRRAGRPGVLARAQSAGDQLGMQATRAAAGTLASVRDSINFPAFVQSLITGVFQAILSSSVQQLGSLGEMLDGVSASADDFQGTIGDAEVGQWLVGKFPALFAVADGGVAVRPEVDLSMQAGPLRAGLSATDDEVSGIDGEDLEGTLMPLARRKIARDRQALLATMVQMGLQRIVVDEGRIHASMDLRVDAQSGSTEDRAQRDDWRVNAAAAGSFSYGPWGASASASTSVGQVKSDQQYTNEQIGVRAGLRSSVDLAFRTEQVPLDRMADPRARVRIDANARVPTDVGGAQGILATAPAPASFSPLPMGDIPAPPTVTAPTPPGRPAPGAGTPTPGGAGTPTPAGAGTPARPGAAAPGSPGAASPAGSGTSAPAAPGPTAPSASRPTTPARPGAAQPGGARGAAPAGRASTPAPGGGSATGTPPAPSPAPSPAAGAPAGNPPLAGGSP